MRAGAPAGGTRGGGSRWLGVAVGLAVLAALLAVGVQRTREQAAVRAALPQLDGRLPVAGLSAPLEILRDAHGVPHVLAASERDAYFGLGFAHAQDRLEQMLWLRRCALGRTAERVGEAGLPADRLARTLGFAQIADAALAQLDADARGVLEAYTAGVNARIARIRRGEVEPPVAAGTAQRDLEERPEPWTPAHTLALLSLYDWGLSGTLDVSLVLSDLIEQVGAFGARPFFPDGSGATVFPTPGRMPLQARAEWTPDPLRRAAHLEGRSVGSSAWVLGGAHTASGRPLVAADSHLEATAPATLYLAHLHSDAGDVVGATLPGVPVFWTGHNGHVAWASTHARVVTTDLFVETFHPDDPDQYHDGRGWRPVERREEVIAVRGGADEKLVVRSTQHGPLIHAFRSEAREPIALHWVGARRGNRSAVASMLAVSRAANASELLAALADHDAPVLALVYADDQGEAGMHVAGWIPRRALTTGLVPLPGRARWYDWRGRISFDALPHARVGRSRAFVVASDNRLPRPHGDEPIEWLWRTGARAARIEALLQSALDAGPVDLRRMSEIQSDVVLPRAQPLIANALALAGPGVDEDPQSREVAALLRAWDGDASSDSVGAAAYHVFLESLTTALLGDTLGEPLLRRYLALPQADPVQAVAEMLEAASAPDPDEGADARAGRIGDAVRASLRDAWFRLSYRLGANRAKWRWGSLHTLSFHWFAAPGAAAERAVALGPYAYGGSGNTVSAAEYDASAPFDVRVASLVRFAMDTGALDQVLVALAPGQSEQPAAPHYDDGVAGWLAGRSWILSTRRLLVEESPGDHLLLEPTS